MIMKKFLNVFVVCCLWRFFCNSYSSPKLTSLRKVSVHGLLNGYSDLSNQPFYTNKLDVRKTMKKFTNKELIWNQIKEELLPGENVEDYLNTICNNASTYRYSDELCGHTKFLSHIKDVLHKKGNMVLLTGGPSLGKTLLLRNISKSSDEIIYLDGRRSSGTMAAAICNALIEKNKFKDEVKTACNIKTTKLQSFTKNITDFFTFKNVYRIREIVGIPDLSAVDLFNAILDSLPKTTAINEVGSMRSILQYMLDSSNVHTIIFDDANMFFHQQSIPILELLTAMTKQNKELSILLSTSEYNFTFSLSQYGYNPNHISHNVMLSDVSPTEVYSLLTSWGVRSKLASLLIDAFGGHILQIIRALDDIKLYQQDYIVSYSFISQIDEQISRCLQDAENRKVSWYNKLIGVLYRLAETGYVPINSNDPVADILVRYNIAGYVPFKAYAPNLLSAKYKVLSTHRMDSSSGYGIVPTTQMMRTAIALKLPRIRKMFLWFKLPRFLMW